MRASQKTDSNLQPKTRGTNLIYSAWCSKNSARETNKQENTKRDGKGRAQGCRTMPRRRLQMAGFVEGCWSTFSGSFQCNVLLLSMGTHTACEGSQKGMRPRDGWRDGGRAVPTSWQKDDVMCFWKGSRTSPAQGRRGAASSLKQPACRQWYTSHGFWVENATWTSAPDWKVMFFYISCNSRF